MHERVPQGKKIGRFWGAARGWEFKERAGIRGEQISGWKQIAAVTMLGRSAFAGGSRRALFVCLCEIPVWLPPPHFFHSPFLFGQPAEVGKKNVHKLLFSLSSLLRMSKTLLLLQMWNFE